MEMSECYSYARCAAPIGNSHRCDNEVIGKSSHCIQHVTTARKLYQKYKKICTKAEDQYKLVSNFNYTYFEETCKFIPLINKTYQLLIDGYEARRIHRNYAFVPELYDSGHDYQFIKLQEMIDGCENIAADIYKYWDHKKDKQEADEEIKIFTEKSENFKKKRKRDRRNDEILLEKYIEDNRDYNELHRDLIIAIIEIVDKLAAKFSFCEDINIVNQGTVSLLLQLKDIGYFEPNFKFQKCNCGTCNNYGAFDLKKMYCRKCNIKETLSSRLKELTSHRLLVIYAILSENIGKFCKILKPFIEFHKIYGDNVFSMNLKLVPCRDETIIFNFREAYSNDVKGSYISSVARMNNKKLNQVGKDLSLNKQLREAFY